MSEILAKNLSYINHYNNSLCTKVSEYTQFCKNFEIKPNFAGEYNLYIDGKGVHSLTDAEDEAESLFSALPHDSKNSIHVLFGLGLGYTADVFSQKAKGAIIVYEPDTEVLRLALEAVDFSKNFDKGNIFFVSDTEEFKTVFESLFRYKTQTSVSFLDYYLCSYRSEYEFFFKELQCIQNILGFNFDFQSKEIYNFWLATAVDLDKKYKKPLITEYKDALKGKPAIIVSAGPSLNKNIDILKKYKDNTVIFCVGTALRTLYDSGITPDFLNIIEKYNTSAHYNLPFIKDISLISEPFTHNDIYKQNFKNHFLTVGLETDTNRWFLEKAEKDLVEFETKGTVSYQALYSAFYLGCSPIILLGQDLAYTDGRCYARGSAYEDLECIFDEEARKYKITVKDFEKFRDFYYGNIDEWSIERKNHEVDIKLLRMNEKLCTVDGQDGTKLPTEPGYALFLEYFKDFARRYKDEVRLINSSTGGALIEDFETVPLEEVFQRHANVPLNKDSFLNFVKDETVFPVTFDVILKNIQKDVNAIKLILPLLDMGKKHVKNLGKELGLSKKYTPRAGQYMKSCADIYVKITNSYSNNNRLLKLLVMKENNELSYIMKENSGSYSYIEVEKISKALEDYFLLVPEKLNHTIKMLEETIIKLKEENESCITKS